MYRNSDAFVVVLVAHLDLALEVQLWAVGKLVCPHFHVGKVQGIVVFERPVNDWREYWAPCKEG